MEVFYGICSHDGKQFTSKVELRDLNEAWSYVDDKRIYFPEIRIMDKRGNLIIHVQLHRIVFPRRDKFKLATCPQ